jgi:hypothetical protein
LHRQATAQPWLYPEDSSIIAVATDTWEAMPSTRIVALDINQPTAIAQFILHWLAREYLYHRRVVHQ